MLYYYLSSGRVYRELLNVKMNEMWQFLTAKSLDLWGVVAAEFIIMLYTSEYF